MTKRILWAVNFYAQLIAWFSLSFRLLYGESEIFHWPRFACELRKLQFSLSVFRDNRRSKLIWFNAAYHKRWGMNMKIKQKSWVKESHFWIIIRILSFVFRHQTGKGFSMKANCASTHRSILQSWIIKFFEMESWWNFLHSSWVLCFNPLHRRCRLHGYHGDIDIKLDKTSNWTFVKFWLSSTAEHSVKLELHVVVWKIIKSYGEKDENLNIWTRIGRMWISSCLVVEDISIMRGF